MEPANHHFLVTGAASGLGAATAKRLVTAGAKVTLFDRHADGVAQMADQLGEHTLNIAGDVTAEADVAGAIRQGQEKLGPLSGAINCAGIALGSRVLSKTGPHPLDDFVRVLQVNLVGTFNVIRLAAEAMSQSPAGEDGERGVIVNTASCAAFDGQIGQAAYSASKAGVAGMTLPIARELARFGIRVVTIAPGVFETPMMAAMSDEVRQSLAAQVPFPPRLGQPDEYAALVLHILENRMLNGTVLRLDGALRMAAK